MQVAEEAKQAGVAKAVEEDLAGVGVEGDDAVVRGGRAGDAAEEEVGGLSGLVEILQSEGLPAGVSGDDGVDGSVECDLAGDGVEGVERGVGVLEEFGFEDERAAGEADHDGVGGEDDSDPEMELEEGAAEEDALRGVPPGTGDCGARVESGGGHGLLKARG